MTDLPSSLGIEAVECLSDGAKALTIRVIGRWRRRRPELRGQPMIVVETAEGRQRFLAMPEPPSLTGAAPGTWRMSFSVPAALAPVLPGRTFLQLGGVMLPVPIGDVEIVPEPPVPAVPDEHRANGTGPATDGASPRAAELAGEVERLERELVEARECVERARDAIAERDRRLRAAEQHVHAERALRADVERELSQQSRVAEHNVRALHDRVADLERELSRTRRAVDEAQHLAAAAQARRAEAERRVPEPVGDLRRASRSRRELELDRSTHAVRTAGRETFPAQRAADRAALHLEAAMARRRDERTGARLGALEAELVAARQEIEAQRRRTARAYEAIAVVRAELRQIRASARQPAAEPRAPSPPAEPSASSPLAAATSVQFVDPPAPRSPVQPERLTEALARLRERTPPEDTADTTPAPPAAETAPAAPAASPPRESPVSSRPAKPWLERPFRALTGADPTAAGRLLLALLPAQRAAGAQAVAYDLVLGDLVCAQVTVGSGEIHVALADVPRPDTEVDFQLVGDLARVARLLVAGPLRRRLPSRRRARVRGERRRLAALDQLVRARLTLNELIGAGVELDPPLSLTLAAAAIDAGWTASERFTLAHRDPGAAAPGAYLHVRDGKPLLASSEPPHGPVNAVVACPAEDLLGVLAGRETRVEGAERPLALVRQWLDRAQCG